MKAKILLINLVIMTLLSGCSYWENVLKEKDPTEGMSAAQIYAQGKDFLDMQDYPNSIKYFDILEARYPFGTYSTQAMLDLAYASYQSDLREEAIVNCDRFIRLYPNHPNVSYAYYLRALSNFDKDSNFITRIFANDPSKYDVSNLRQSFDDFTLEVNRFPDSKYSKDSRNRLIYIKNMIAENELYIAKYYNKRSAHVAAVERIKYMLKNYSGTPSSEGGLLLMIDSYNKLKMTDLAYDTSRVLKENYPDYIIVKKNDRTIEVNRKNKELKRIQDKETRDANSRSWYSYFNPFSYF